MPANALPVTIDAGPNPQGRHTCAVKLALAGGLSTLTLSIGEEHESALDVEIDAIERAAEHLQKTLDHLNRQLAARKAKRGPA
jgi:hypothetical protein